MACIHSMACSMDGGSYTLLASRSLAVNSFFVEAGLPLAFCLNQRDTVLSVFIANTDEDWVSTAGDEYVVLFVDSDSVLGEDGDSVVVGKATDADERIGEVIECVCLCGVGRKVGERKHCDVLPVAGAAIGNANAFGGGTQYRELG